MLVPPQYDNKLCNLIDKHTRNGMIPDKYVINYFNIGSELSNFLKSQNLTNSKILEIGGRTCPLYELDEFKITPYEDRERYKKYFLKEDELNFNYDQSLKNILSEYDVIIVHADYIAEQGDIQSEISTLNTLIDKQRFFVIEYRWENYKDNITKVSIDGIISNTGYYQQWFDFNRSHMHLGYKSEELKTLRIYDFSYFY